jgi:predicted ATPase/class 3 adenylate cyclase
MIGEPQPDTLTFLFTDLESSTQLWETLPDAMSVAVERHDQILRAAVEQANGRVVKVTGDGVMAVFSSAAEAAEGSLRAQLALRDEAWGETGPLRVRMGIHAGDAQQRAGDFFGPPVNRTARIMAAGHGGQVLLSALAAQLAGERLPAESALRDLGDHRLKDLSQPEHIFQLVHPSLASDFPPLATLSRRPNNLPTQASEFLGREAQLSAVRDLLDTGRVRLLTLTGPGGIGKTRLALQAAADQIDRFEDGVYFVDLAPARDPEAAFEAVVRAIGLSGTAEDSSLDLLRAGLPGKHMLLLLDNFEQVMRAADGVAELLQQCPQLTILVTSREALRVRGEHLVDVPPLAVPDPSARLSAEAVAECDAVRLFVERARQARPDFALTDHNAEAVAEISTRLEGLPLAIELAAARLTLFSPDELRERLRSRLELLGRGSRDLPARQQTLRGTIEWSYELLNDEERTIFRLLSVFAPTRVEAVEQVAGRLEQLRDLDVVESLASLVDKSLVRSVETSGVQQLSMLETIREYAQERLEELPDLSSSARRAQAEHFADFARSRRDRLYGPERDGTLDELESELGNLLTAWRYWVDAGETGWLESLLEPLWVLHDARGWYHAAIDLTNDLLAMLAAAPSKSDHVQKEITVRSGLARGLLAIRGYTQEVEEGFNQVLALAEAAGELPQRSSVLRSLASFHMFRAEFDKGAMFGRRLLELAEREDDTGLQVDGHLVLGASLSFNGDLQTGLEHLDRAIALFDPHRHGPGVFRFGPNPGVVAHTTSGFLLWLRGRPERAEALGLAAVQLARELHHPFTLVYTLFHVGFLDYWRREFELVHERASNLLEIAEEHDYPIWRALGLVLQGAALTATGRADEGSALSDRGIALYQGLQTPPVFWPLLLSLRARGLAEAGRSVEAIALVDEAIETIPEQHVLYPELGLLNGDLLVSQGNADGAELRFRSAFDVSRDFGLRMPQLRAATRLARLRERDADAIESLRSVYDTFTEGFDSRDLVEARAVLAEVDVPIP